MIRTKLLSLLLALPGLIAAQSLDLQQNRFTEDVRVLGPADYLRPETLRILRDARAQLPGPIAVGSLNGVTYLYRDNGLALFATAPTTEWQQMSRDNSWAIDCTKDAMTDAVVCTLDRGDLTVALSDSGAIGVLVGKNHYPNSEVAIRPDQDQPFRIHAPGFESPQASEIVNRLTTAKAVTTRYQEWPNQANTDRIIDLYGFNEALSFLRWVVSRYK